MLDFFKELVARLKAKNSKFFNVLQWVAAIAALLTGLPAFLEMFNVVLPEALTVLQSKVVAIASTVVFVLAQLDVDPIVIKGEETTTDEFKLASSTPKKGIELPFSE